MKKLATRVALGRPAFDDYDVAVLDAVSELIATALRAHVVVAAPRLGAPATPGMMVFGDQDRLLSSIAEALRWLEELQSFSDRDRDWIGRLGEPGPFDATIPTRSSP